MNPELSKSTGDSAPIFRAFPTDARPRPRVRPLLLPEAVLRPWVLLAVWTLPQVLLLFLNWQAWELASGEFSADQRQTALWIFAVESLMLAGGVAVFAALTLMKRSFERFMGAIPLALGVFFLAVVYNFAASAIPDSIADWMVPRDQWMLKQFALTMPAALFGALRLLCPDRESADPGTIGRAVATTVALFAGCLVLPFISGMFLMGFRAAVGPEVAGFIIGGLFMALSVLAAASLLRISVSFYQSARVHSPALLSVFAFFVALAGPIIGLLLNISIPFPSNFQIPAVYVFAILNGVILMLPNFSHAAAHRAVWLAQCALFPFTLYFFAVFLPFLMLGPLGMLFFGLGILIYVPSLLFLLHGFRLLDGYRAEIRDGSRLWPAILGVGAMLIWPVAYTAQAGFDKSALNRALDYLQYPDYGANGKFTGSLRALHSSLTHLTAFKQGIYLPYLSEYYNWIAFDNLVLPQEKLDALSLVFLGKKMPKPEGVHMDMFGWGRGNRARSVTEVMDGGASVRPRTDAILRQMQTTSQVDQGTVRVNVAMTVANPTSIATEFSTTIKVPPGVMISGLWLTIGTERVPGRLFEKRSALWVYQKITEVRPVLRDPAILRYIAPSLVELKVFPVEPGAPRHVEVEFLYPVGLTPSIELGSGQLVQVPVADREGASIARTEDGRFNLIIPPVLGLPIVTRHPYLHFLVDASKSSRFSDPEVLRNELRRLRTQFPNVHDARLTFVNFETRDFREGAILPFEELLRTPAKDLGAPDFFGGFFVSRAIKEVVWRHHLALAQTDSPALSRYPQIAVVSGADHEVTSFGEDDLAEFSRFLPDQPGYWESNGDGLTAHYVPFDDHDEKFEASAVNIFQIGGQRFAAAVNSPVSYFSLQPVDGPVNKLEVYDPEVRKFISSGAPLEQPASGKFAKAIAPWSLQLQRLFEPFRGGPASLGELIRLCRQTGILVPSVAYMVVENTAQWKMLERTEKKALKGHEALELSEPAVPEPGTVVLLLIGVAVIIFAARCRPSRT